jgi:FkbM family methyltransferase
MYNNTKEVQRWFADGGDDAMRYTYLLDESSTIVDLGGYKGNFADRIFKKYGSTVHVFEPVTEFYKECVAANLKNARVFVHHEGISAYTDGHANISITGDGSSVFALNTTAKSEKIRLKPIHYLFSPGGLNLSKIDLLKMNVEGAEFEIIEALLRDGMAAKIRNLQVQFHPFVPNAEERLSLIHEKLRKTHRLTFNYRFVWENWTINAQQNCG